MSLWSSKYKRLTSLKQFKPGVKLTFCFEGRVVSMMVNFSLLSRGLPGTVQSCHSGWAWHWLKSWALSLPTVTNFATQNMSESLRFLGSLEGHKGWVTAIATSSENPDMILTASRGIYHIFLSQNNWPLTSYQQTRRSLSGNWLAMMILTDTLNEFSTGTTTLSLMLSFLPTANSPCPPHGTTLFVFGILTLVSQRAVSSDTHPMFSQSASVPTIDKSSLDRAIRQSSFGILWASASMISKTTATPSG